MLSPFRCNLLVIFLLSLLVLSIAPPVSARDMHGRVGLGYNNQFTNSISTNGVPGISLKYGLTSDVSIQGILALSTTDPKNSATAVKLFKSIHHETSLTFYFMLGGGIVAAAGNSGAEFLSGFGAEFFIPGLESLGISFETGVILTNISGGLVVKTMGANFLDAGIHFYF